MKAKDAKSKEQTRSPSLSRIGEEGKFGKNALLETENRRHWAMDSNYNYNRAAAPVNKKKLTFSTFYWIQVNCEETNHKQAQPWTFQSLHDAWSGALSVKLSPCSHFGPSTTIILHLVKIKNLRTVSYDLLV